MLSMTACVCGYGGSSVDGGWTVGVRDAGDDYR